MTDPRDDWDVVADWIDSRPWKLMWMIFAVLLTCGGLTWLAIARGCEVVP